MASLELENEIFIIKNAASLAEFRRLHPDGYTIMDGDRGIGLLGSNAEFAQNCGSDPNKWISFAQLISPALYQAHEEN